MDEINKIETNNWKQYKELMKEKVVSLGLRGGKRGAREGEGLTIVGL